MKIDGGKLRVTTIYYKEWGNHARAWRGTTSNTPPDNRSGSVRERENRLRKEKLIILSKRRKFVWTFFLELINNIAQ